MKWKDKNERELENEKRRKKYTPKKNTSKENKLIDMTQSSTFVSSTRSTLTWTNERTNGRAVCTCDSWCYSFEWIASNVSLTGDVQNKKQQTERREREREREEKNDEHIHWKQNIEIKCFFMSYVQPTKQTNKQPTTNRPTDRFIAHLQCAMWLL